jgi:hypothetical protein
MVDDWGVRLVGRTDGNLVDQWEDNLDEIGAVTWGDWMGIQWADHWVVQLDEKQVNRLVEHSVEKWERDRYCDE